METAGINAKILPEKNGNPVVYGEVKSKSNSKTLLIYGHYDVQPPEPLEKWVSGPFDAKMQGKKIVPSTQVSHRPGSKAPWRGPKGMDPDGHGLRLHPGGAGLRLARKLHG